MTNNQELFDKKAEDAVEAMNQELDMALEDDRQAVVMVDKPVETRAEIQKSDLLRFAISQGVDTEKLEKLIELRNREEERQAKQEFDTHFAAMQSEFEPVKREKEGYGYKYAPLELLQKQYAPIISRHGFAYRWREESLPEGGKKTVLIISGWGHTNERTTFDVPKLEKTKQQNDVQVLGSMSTYGKRYTFMSGFGIIVEDEDDDAFSYEDGVIYAEHIKLLRESNTVEELHANWKLIYGQIQGNKDALSILVTEKDNRKKELK